ncbi:MAG: hypothetical protein ACE5R4_08150 [Armatimonadota bacterium]
MDKALLDSQRERMRRLVNAWIAAHLEALLPAQSAATGDQWEALNQRVTGFIDRQTEHAKRHLADEVGKVGTDADPVVAQIEDFRRAEHARVQRELFIERAKRERKAPRDAEAPRPSLEFMQHRQLRAIASRDYRECRQAFEAGAHKATLVMAGAAAEGVLLDALEAHCDDARRASCAPKGPLRRWNLGKMIEVAYEPGLVTGSAEQFSDAIRHHRNLVHPARERRDSLTVDQKAAEAARGVLDLIIDSVRKSHEEASAAPQGG